MKKFIPFLVVGLILTMTGIGFSLRNSGEALQDTNGIAVNQFAPASHTTTTLTNRAAAYTNVDVSRAMAIKFTAYTSTTQTPIPIRYHVGLCETGSEAMTRVPVGGAAAPDGTTLWINKYTSHICFKGYSNAGGTLTTLDYKIQ